MAEEKTDRNMQLIQDAESMNTVELAEKYGITRERVRQILDGHGVTTRHFKRSDVRHALSQMEHLLGTTTDGELADNYGISYAQVRNYRASLQIPAFVKPIGCEKCESEPYAKGLCHNCYCRKLRRK